MSQIFVVNWLYFISDLFIAHLVSIYLLSFSIKIDQCEICGCLLVDSQYYLVWACSVLCIFLYVAVWTLCCLNNFCCLYIALWTLVHVSTWMNIATLCCRMQMYEHRAVWTNSFLYELSGLWAAVACCSVDKPKNVETKALADQERLQIALPDQKTVTSTIKLWDIQRSIQTKRQPKDIKRHHQTKKHYQKKKHPEKCYQKAPSSERR